MNMCCSATIGEVAKHLFITLINKCTASLATILVSFQLLMGNQI